MIAPTSKADRLPDHPLPPLSGGDRKPEPAGPGGDRRADLHSLPPSSLADRKLEAGAPRDLLAQAASNDALRDGAITGGQRVLRDVAGQKIELMKGLEQGLVLPGAKSDSIKEGLALTSGQKVEGLVRPGDATGLAGAGKGDPLKPGDGQLLTGAQKVDGAKQGDALGALKNEPGKPGDVTATAGGGKWQDGITGGHSTHTDIVGQKDGDPLSGKRPEATEKIDDRKEGQADAKGDKPGKKPEDETSAISDAPFVAGLVVIPEKDDGKQDKSDKTDDDNKNKKDSERRQKYIVKKGDTLELIAAKMLRDQKLAPLIYDINRNLIPSKMQNGRRVLDLRPKLVIYLPAPTEIKDYRALPGAAAVTKFEYALQYSTPDEELQDRYGNWSGDRRSGGITGDSSEIGSSTAIEKTARAGEAAEKIDDTYIEKPTESANNIENCDTSELLVSLVRAVEEVAETQYSTDRIRYTVRMGDSLKSVAIKHPALRDASLWKLLAEVNNLPTSTDSRGVPIVRLTRGSTILIPSLEEIRRSQQRIRVQPVAPYTVVQGSTKIVPTIPDVNSQSKRAVRADSEAIQQAVQAKGNSVSELGQQCRLVKLANDDMCEELRLEFEHRDSWCPVIAYQIFNDRSMRQEFYPDGSKRTLKIDLPLAAVQELAENDILTNWQQYREAYLHKLES